MLYFVKGPREIKHQWEGELFRCTKIFKDIGQTQDKLQDYRPPRYKTKLTGCNAVQKMF